LEIYDENKNCVSKMENIFGYEDIQVDDKHLLVVSTFVLKETGKKEKKDYLFAIYDFKDLSKPTKTISTSLTDRVKIKASLDQKYILVNTINDNTSNKSYYGQSTIYFYEVLTGKFTKFNLPEGPVHDFNWCPDDEHFIICAGHLPSTVKYYKKNGTFEKDIAKGNFNNVKISPDSRIVALCGFGSLKGDIEFYNLKDFSLIGKNLFFCCVNFEWSQDSKYLLGGVLSTRVKVDNEYRIMKYNGEEVVVDKNVGEIYDCIFVYEEDEQKIKYDEFEIEKNAKSLEEKKKENKGGSKITSTLGKIDFSNKSKDEPVGSGEIIGLGKKKKKKKNK
jgi:translation initiation factor 2A